MPSQNNSPDVDYRINDLTARNIAAASYSGMTRAMQTQEDNVKRNIPFRHCRVHDALATNLPAAASSDDMGLVTGTPGTNAPTLQGVDFGNGSSDEKCAFEHVLGPEYVAGQSVTLRARAGMLTTLPDSTITLDVECWKADGDGLVGSDLCTTAATSIKSLTLADKDFAITATALAPGDKLIIRLSFAGSDTGDAGVMIPVISELSVLEDTKG